MILCGLSMSSISVIVGTFGDRSWIDTAKSALDSVVGQTAPATVFHVHADSLEVARNTGAEMADSEWLCFLDADDTLHSGYIEAMQKKIEEISNSNGLLQPSHVNSADRPTGKAGVISMIPPRPILDGNYLIIGTLVKRDTFLRVGGFRDLPLYEDWDLWIRCFRDGATHHTVPKAVYQIKVNQDSRNEPDRRIQIETANKIRASYRNH